MTTKSTMLPLAILALAVAASAADISGTWKGTAQTPAGSAERTFNFKVDGNKLTGDTSSDMFGKSAIEDGKIDGDTVTFTVTIEYQGNQGKVNYTGKIKSDDEIDFSVEVPSLDQKIEYVAKRVK
jgi:autotransporter translocation and assembly factor TamB